MIDDVFASLPDDAHVWIHATNRPLKNNELDALQNELVDFSSSWTSHGREVKSAFQIIERRVLLIAARLPEGDVSGCGIDSLIHRLEQVANSLNFSWNGPLDIFYRNDEGVYQRTTRADFADLIERGTVDENTPILDVSVSRLGDVRANGIEHALRESWASDLFATS